MATHDVGGKYEDMQRLQNQFTTEGGHVNDVMKALDGIVNNVIRSGQWTGQAAKQFEGLWDNEFKKSLTGLQDALAKAAEEVKNRATALQEADRT